MPYNSGDWLTCLSLGALLVQVALLVVMAQVGCFVPAEFMSLGIVDKLFTRMGTADSLENNCSSFMAEMHDAAHIIDNATSR